MHKRHKRDALAAVYETALGLREAGVIDKRAMKDFDGRRLTPVKERAPGQVRLCAKASHAKTTPRATNINKNESV